MTLASIPVTNIQLDPQNPRVAWMADGTYTTQDLFQEYWEYEDILQLVRNIDSLGYWHHGQILVLELEPGKKYCVMEGNRRVVAVRSILDPTLAPPKRRAYLETVKAKRKSELENLSAWIYPSRDSVLPIIIATHASPDTSSWESLMKARLYWDYFNTHKDRLTVDQIIAALGVSKSEFQDKFREYLLYSHIKGIDAFTPEDRERIANERRFPISTLVRIVKVQSVREELGLTEHWDLIQEHSSTFRARAYLIALDIAHERQNSRTLDTNEKIIEYFGRIKQLAGPSPAPVVRGGSQDNPEPTATESGSGGTPGGSPGGLTHPGDVTGVHQNPTPPPRRRSRSERKSFFQSRVSFCITGNDALKRLFDTLNDNKKVIPEDDAIACGILVRSFLDKGTRVLFERKGILKVDQKSFDWSTGSKVEKITSVDVSNSGVRFVELLQLARGLHAVALGVDAGIAESLKSFENPVGGGVAMLEKLNNLVHKPAGDITSAELRDLWPRLEKYVRLLVEVV